MPKPCEIPASILKYQALMRRLIDNHLVKYDVVTDFNNRMTGFLGEQSVMNFHLDPLLNSSLRIYHDLRLLHGNYYFQIDILILSAYYALVLEVKNRSKDWYFDKVLNQATLEKSRTKNPILQAQLQAYKLKAWLKGHNITGLPIQYLFVNANEKTNIFISEDNKYKWNVCNSEYLLEKIEQTNKFFKIEMFDEKVLRKIDKLLLTNHTPENLEILPKYNLSRGEILTGVHCPKCNFLPMTYHAGTWRCPKCRTDSKVAFMETIKDYFLLIQPSITNEETRRFLQIDSPKMAHQFLNTMELNHTGKFKDRIYYL